MIERVKWALAALAVFAFAFGAAAGSFEVYAPKHRPAEELAPLVSAVMGAGGAAIADAHSGKIVLSGDPATLAQARAALASLDQPVPQYRVDSESSTRAALDGAGLRVDGWVEAGSVRIGRVRGPEGVRLRGGAGGVTASERLTATVVVLEGRAAEVWTGAAVPVTSRSVERLGPYARATETTELVDVRSGFRVRPRSAGPDAVELEITPIVSQLRADGAIHETGAATQIRVSPGESVVLGSIASARQETSVALPRGAASAADGAESLLVVRVTRVDAVPAARDR